jgi:hypothetical protein
MPADLDRVSTLRPGIVFQANAHLFAACIATIEA